jgi:hypothetical protein
MRLTYRRLIDMCVLVAVIHIELTLDLFTRNRNASSEVIQRYKMCSCVVHDIIYEKKINSVMW